MNKDLQKIRQRMRNMQYGILRYKGETSKNTWQVQTAPGDEDLLHCVVTNDDVGQDLENKSVNLIQKSKDDYLYITGTVSSSENEDKKVLSIHILKACWFVRKSKGQISWLQEKYIYENYKLAELEIA